MTLIDTSPSELRKKPTGWWVYVEDCTTSILKSEDVCVWLQESVLTPINRSVKQPVWRDGINDRVFICGSHENR